VTRISRIFTDLIRANQCNPCLKTLDKIGQQVYSANQSENSGLDSLCPIVREKLVPMSDKSKIEWTDATWNSIWSARTCLRFGTTRHVASCKMESSHRSPNPKVVFFFKQWGGVRKSETGRELDGKTYDEFPERRQTSVPDLEFRRNALERLEVELI